MSTITEKRNRSVPMAMDGVLTFVSSRLGFVPDARQTEVLTSGAKRGILNCTRQWGKSTVAAAMAVHRAFTVEDSLVVVASPTERQSAEFVRKASRMVRKLGIKPRGDGDNATSLLFPNGSRIVGLPGTEGTVRGFSAVSLLLIDEASRVQDEMYKSLRPMLAVGGGDLWLMSTPYGKRGFFYDTWADGGEEWLRVTVKGPECERIAGSFLEEEKRAMGMQWYEQEYLCAFVDSAANMFGRDLVMGAMSEDVEPLKTV
jgi:hypothetical protein